MPAAMSVDVVPPAVAWDWASEDLTRELVRELQAGVVLETRAFLRPIFKWMKMGVRKSGQKNGELVAKTFAFVDWMVQLSRDGDAARGIPAMPKLQPSYALNTIVTSSQRAGSLDEAVLAFERLVSYGYEPDVFTYTALIDVTARSGDVARAIKTYEEMRQTKSRPNIVTFTTIIRAIGFTDAIAPAVCLEFLAHARNEETFDEALYADALDVCAVRKDVDTAGDVLRFMKAAHVSIKALRNSDRLIRVLAKIVGGHGEPHALLSAWRDEGLITADEEAGVMEPRAREPRCNGSKTLGCLGNQTSETVRLAVVQHDISRLIDRVASGDLVSTNDFETLIHQCRKRKWKNEVRVIVNAMRTLATVGWSTSTAEQAISLDPQPHLMPTSKTYVSIVDAYLASGDEILAWEAFGEVETRSELHRELALYRKYVRGCYLLTNCGHISEMIALAHHDHVTFTNRMCVEIARMHGHRHQEGIDIILHRLPPANRAKIQQYMEELVTSCAYKHNSQGVEDTIKAMVSHNYQRSSKTEMAGFICCLQHPVFEPAQEMLHMFQATGLMLNIPMYESLLREMYFKYTRRGSTFDESSRSTAMRTLQLRRALFDHAFQDRAALESRFPNADVEDICPLRYWCELHELDCSPLMFSQHVVELITTIRDKETKLATMEVIRQALLTTPDPFLFNLRAVVALRLLDITYRGQGKLAKQMLTLLDGLDFEVLPHHLGFCLDQLHVLTVHIVKEIDDVVGLHQYNRNRILEFCVSALDNDNVDKTIGYILSKESLYTVETAEYLTPKLAEIYVLNGIVTALQFFKPEVDHSMTIRRQFLREVIEVETLSEEDENATFPHTRRAIVEFKLEHEAEFMPYVMRSASTFTNPELTTSILDSTMYLIMPLDDDHVIIVDQDDALALAHDVLMHQGNVSRIGIDAEWRPDQGRGYIQSRCSVLQIACDSHVFLFDLLELSISDLEELFAYLFGSEKVLKLGFALDGDLKKLRWTFPEAKCFDQVGNVLDFAHDDLPSESKELAAIQDPNTRKQRAQEHRAAVNKRRQRGLSALIQEHVGFPLNKTQQKSDWEQRPLTPKQVTYAALDAYCLLMLHDAVNQLS